MRSTGSRHAGFSSCGSWALERRLSSCGAWAYLLRGMWDLSGPGLEPVSYIGRQILNHCATREAQKEHFLNLTEIFCQKATATAYLTVKL